MHLLLLRKRNSDQIFCLNHPYLTPEQEVVPQGNVSEQLGGCNLCERHHTAGGRHLGEQTDGCKHVGGWVVQGGLNKHRPRLPVQPLRRVQLLQLTLRLGSGGRSVGNTIREQNASGQEFFQQHRTWNRLLFTQDTFSGLAMWLGFISVDIRVWLGTGWYLNKWLNNEK